MSWGGYFNLPSVLSFGIAGGVLDTVGGVDVVGTLEARQPALSRSATDPDSVLLLEDEWPDPLPKPFSKLGRTYPALVHRAVGAGMHNLVHGTKENLFHDPRTGKPVLLGGSPSKKLVLILT